VIQEGIIGIQEGKRLVHHPFGDQEAAVEEVAAKKEKDAEELDEVRELLNGAALNLMDQGIDVSQRKYTKLLDCIFARDHRWARWTPRTTRACGSSTKT
jgi:hypothetical protein